MGLVWALPSSAYSQPCFYMILYDTQVKSLTIIYWHLNDPVPGDWCTSKPQSLSTRTLSPFRKDRIMQCGCSKLQCPNSRPTLGSESQKPCSTYFYRKMHMVWCCSNIRGVVERYWIYISIWKSKDPKSTENGPYIHIKSTQQKKHRKSIPKPSRIPP